MSEKGQILQALYLETPTPEVRQALDWAAAPLQAARGPVLALLSSPFYAVEVLRRVTHALDLAGCSSAFEPVAWLAELAPWSWAGVGAADLAGSHIYTALLWAEPERQGAEDLARRLFEAAAPGAVLSVVASTFLRRFLPAWQEAAPPPAVVPLSASQIPGLLRRAGWQVSAHCGLHGPRAVAWTLLMRLAEAGGRPDWADRARFAMRQAYLEKGWRRSLAPLQWIQASHP